jgi:hypothetical protein
MAARGADAARAHADSLGKQPASFAQAVELAAAKNVADEAAIHRDYPQRSIGKAALKSGLAAAAFGPAIVSSGRNIAGSIKDYMTARRS